MRLAVVTHKAIKGEGQARVNYEIARRAALCGWQVTLVASEVAPELRALPGVQVVPVPWSARRTALVGVLDFARRSGRWLRQHRSELDVVHVNGYITDAPGDVNAAHFVHGAWLRSPAHTSRVHRNAYGAYHFLFSLLNARLERNAFAQARQVVAISGRVRRELMQIGVPERKIEVIPNGVDGEEFRPGPPDRRALRAALDLPAGVPLALFVGNLRVPLKNLDTVLRALAQTPGLHLAVAGELAGSPYPAMARQLGLTERVHWLGFRRDVNALMRAADLLVFPSRYEPFALVILEAMASGLPLITASTVGAAELVTPDCGLIVDDPEDADTLAQAMRELSADAPRRLRMGCAARAIAEGCGWERMADRYLALYTQEARS